MAHAATTLVALQADKHVYSEKPAATSVAEAQRLRDEATQRGLTFVPTPSVMLFPQVRSGKVGRVTAALGRRYAVYRPERLSLRSQPIPSRRRGPLADMGVYPLHALTGILGPARHVSAFASQIQDGFTVSDGHFAGKRIPVEVEDNWRLLFDFGGGRLASVTANNVARDSRALHMELFGLGGTIAVDLLNVYAPVETLLPDEGWQQHHLPHQREAGPDHVLGVEHLVDCITSGEPPIPSIEHAIHVLEIMEAAAISSRSGQAVKLQTTFG